jgi:hypothetical protein
MKFCFLLSLLILTGCENNPEKAKLDNNLVNHDTLKLINITHSNISKSTSLLIIDDTVFLYSPSNTKVKDYSVIRLYFDDHDRTFQFNFINDQGHYRNQDQLASALAKANVKLYSLETPGIIYPLLSEDIKQDSILKPFINEENKVQVYGGRYYFIKSILPTSLYIYDTLNHKLTSFDVHTDFFEIKDFFMYDLDRDEEPEIFILNTGHRSDEEIISYSIYSIRRDSVKVEFK